MDNREENSRNTEQDRVDNPVENTVSTMVETALSENKRERKKREKAEKKKNVKIAEMLMLYLTYEELKRFFDCFFYNLLSFVVPYL